MSDPSRNRRFARKSNAKSRKSRSHEDADGPRESAHKKRSAGTKQIDTLAAPRSPKNFKKNQPKHARSAKPAPSHTSAREGGAGWIWGQHAVAAALANSSRTIHMIRGTEAALARHDLPDAPSPTSVEPNIMDRDFGPGHQGIALKCAPLEWPSAQDFIEQSGPGIILVLDHVTDPHNVGAMIRLCSAFDVRALILQSRHAPPMSGATAKVAVGCLETVPVCEVTNIANTLNMAKSAGWMVSGLAGESSISLAQGLVEIDRHIIVMGAEGPGLRPRVRDNCDQLLKIPMLSGEASGEAESLNVSTAAAITLYEIRRGTE